MGVLLLAMTLGGLAAAAILITVSFLTKQRWLRNFVVGGVGVWCMFYLALLLGFSLVSEERFLGLHEPKEFCGFYLDCHLHTAVTDVRKAKKIGNKTANGEFYIVTVKVFSNARRATLGFGRLDLHVIDADGRVYRHSPDAEPPDPWFTRPVPAGGSFERDVVFDLPTDIRDPRLDMQDDKGLIEKFVIADEDSILHKRAYFRLQGASADFQVRY